MLMISIIEQCIGIKRLIITIIVHFIGIKLLMISIIVHCIAHDKHSCALHCL